MICCPRKIVSMSTLSRSCKIALLFAAGLFYVGTVWSADHIQIRNIMIESQLAQVETTAVLMVGDSIVESWLVGPAGQCQVINAGLGGWVSNVITLLHKLKQKTNRVAGLPSRGENPFDRVDHHCETLECLCSQRDKFCRQNQG